MVIVLAEPAGTMPPTCMHIYIHTSSYVCCVVYMYDTHTDVAEKENEGVIRKGKGTPNCTTV